MDWDRIAARQKPYQAEELIELGWLVVNATAWENARVPEMRERVVSERIARAVGRANVKSAQS